MNPACSPLGSALANIFHCAPPGPAHTTFSSITRDVSPGRFVPGTRRPSRPLAGRFSARRLLRQRGQPLAKSPDDRHRPCSSGSFQEMAPLQHPTARGRSPQAPRGGESPAPAPAGSPRPAASWEREMLGASGLSFSASLGGLFSGESKDRSKKKKGRCHEIFWV